MSLPVLGTFYSGDLAGGYLSVWTTFDVVSHQEPPELFSVATFSALAHDQIRFFCSAENKDGPATPEEETQVYSVITTVYKALRTGSPLVEGIEPESAFRDSFGYSHVLGIGSLHNKWAPYLAQHAARKKDEVCTTFFRPPQLETSKSVELAGDKWNIDTLQERDIDLVTDRTAFPRTRQSMLTRIPYSICVRPKGQDAPIAWELLYPDGSIGMLHVEPEYRRMGLGKLVIRSLCDKLEEVFHTDDKEKASKYPWARWELVHVIIDNQKSLALLKSLESDGWQRGWSCRWFFMTMDLDPGSEVDHTDGITAQETAA